ncbi:MAG: ADP-ribosylglycohydrolase family protein [Bacteroidales bacterium]|nr:ADP-ribosylglycohydrolase family protein [Bacteroidales bacterium]
MKVIDDKIKDKIKSCIFGQAIGDALGLGTEFMSAEEVKHHYPDGLRDYSQIIQDKHRRRFVRGRWTDDTDMMLCVLYGFENSSEINVGAVAANFKNWADGVPMGIGRHTYEVLSFWDYLQNPFKAAEIIWELSGRESAANGGIMRTSAVGLLKDNVREYAEKVCKLTHPDPRCIKSCILISELISSLIWKDTELEYDDMVSVAENDAEFISYLSKAKECDIISQLELDDPKFMGYTYKTMSAVLWVLWHCSLFEEGLLAVVNAGGDADTNAAVACSVLGAKYGFSAIPEKYVQGLCNSDVLHKTSEVSVKRLIA